jgi:Fe-Mn family superoxide dismutase
MNYEEKKFKLNHLNGISEKQIEEHLKLYAGYVKHTNLISEKQKELSQEEQKNSYAIAEITRRLGFEFNGMRMHEYYFEQLEEGSKNLNENSLFANFIKEKYADFDSALLKIKNSIKLRGIGWVVVYYDKQIKELKMAWVDEHQNGQLAGLPIIIVVDMWEHAFMVDYLPSEKSKYTDAFFENLNWEVVEKRFEDSIK